MSSSLAFDEISVNASLSYSNVIARVVVEAYTYNISSNMLRRNYITCIRNSKTFQIKWILTTLSLTANKQFSKYCFHCLSCRIHLHKHRSDRIHSTVAVSALKKTFIIFGIHEIKTTKSWYWITKKLNTYLKFVHLNTTEIV